MANSFLGEGSLGLLMYLDEGLVKNLSSLVLSGYIQIRTTKLIQDKSLSERIGSDNRNHMFDENRGAEDIREGFVVNNNSNVCHNEETWHNKVDAENRDFIRREEELQTIYTTFNLHGQLFQQLDTANKIVKLENTTVREGQVSEGDYIKIKGILTSESIKGYIESLQVLFDCFGCDNLNTIIPSSESKFKCKNRSIFNYTSICKMLSKLNEILNRNNTQDLILRCGDTSPILNVNNSFFMNNTSYIYDMIDCPCTVFGKVIHVAKPGESISLLRKTSQEEYYESVLNSFLPYCNVLESSGIVVPKMPRLKCEGVSIIILPISIST